MTVRVLVTLHLPMEMGAAGRILKAVAREFPDSTVATSAAGERAFRVQADDDVLLTKTDRRRLARGRRFAGDPEGEKA